MNDVELQDIRRKKMEKVMRDGGEEFPSTPVEVNDSEFNSFIGKYPLVIVDCWAPWCMPCRMLSPTIDALAKEFTGRVVFGKLNTDNNEGTAMRFQIMSIPTLLFFKNGKMVDSLIGVLPKQEIASRINKHL